MIQQQTFVAPLRLPITVGATTPNPGNPCIIWSTTVSAFLQWIGSSWQLLDSSAATASYINLAANFANATITPAPITGWAIPVIANKTYKIEIVAAHQTGVTTAGGRLGIHLVGGGAGTVRGMAQATVTQGAGGTCVEAPIWAVGAIGLAGSGVISTGVNPINAPHSFLMNLIFRCTVSGTLNIDWASEVAASSARLNAGSALTYSVLN